MSVVTGTIGAMLDHVSLQVTDVDAAAAWYARLLAPLAVREVLRFDGPVVGFAGPDRQPRFWLCPAAGATGREVHIAFSAADRDAVHRVHDVAVAAGCEVLHAPREWPEYHPGYYAVFVRDLDGNNVEAVHHGTA